MAIDPAEKMVRILYILVLTPVNMVRLMDKHFSLDRALSLQTKCFAVLESGVWCNLGQIRLFCLENQSRIFSIHVIESVDRVGAGHWQHKFFFWCRCERTLDELRNGCCAELSMTKNVRSCPRSTSHLFPAQMALLEKIVLSCRCFYIDYCSVTLCPYGDSSFCQVSFFNITYRVLVVKSWNLCLA